MKPLNTEKWIPGYENIYSATTDGNIYSHIRSGKLLMPGSLNNYGYKIVGLTLNKKKTTKTVHRLICITFLENPQNHRCINHKDGNKLNNNIDNLEWCSDKHNMQHAFKLGLVGKHLKDPRPSRRKKIGQYSKNGEFIKEWIGIKITANELNIRRSSITNCLAGRIKSAGGYVWHYL